MYIGKYVRNGTVPTAKSAFHVMKHLSAIRKEEICGRKIYEMKVFLFKKNFVRKSFRKEAFIVINENGFRFLEKILLKQCFSEFLNGYKISE